MTTCRLLCGLLVLALCCCPSVCVTTSDVTPVLEPDLGSSRDETSEIEDNGQASSSAAADVLSGPSPEPDPQKSPVVETPTPTTKEVQGEADTLNGNDGEAAPQGISGPGPALPKTPNAGTPGLNTKEQEPGDSGTQGTKSRNSAATDQTTTNVDDSAETSAATTTNTTTTTTTTTTAPEAPSTTTTEAPTTTTTRAPSRLPEIDGSLGSSAWVCAPLLLAVSALAYTTLG
ncbi:mucin TcMUCII, putative [Trypanosoma cruzi marinkellei]|uniref:Mucin TcMUCII, putative n=1 Tax=Trypanosoma cruzi marinkellei TaxID=85056 RepID=K2MU96_TRYCR|nr:mucin TcMUCII, putative [Trypanosoma cruzi marinkellei]